ncbi:PQQ-like beta-propeller repeat protein [Nocardiopsis sp. ARC36]
MRNLNGKKAFVCAACLVIASTGCDSSIPGSPQDDRETFAGYAVTHETTDSAPSEAPKPTTVTEVGWVWEGPERTRVDRIHPIPTGAVLHLGNGAVGLDTATGEEVWSFLLPEHDSETGGELAVSPDGTLVAFSPGESLVLLNSATGEEIRRVDHGDTGEGHLVVDRVGAVANNGLVNANGGPELSVTLTPWDGDEQGWEAVLSVCDENVNAIVDQGLLTDGQVVVTYTCGESAPAMVGLDQETGDEMWRLQEGEDYRTDQYMFAEEDAQFTVIGDNIVLQNISSHRGTVVINAVEGEVIADDLPSSPDNTLVRVLADGYLSVRRIAEGTGQGVAYELNDFSGEVLNTFRTDEEVARGSTVNFLVLEESLLKIRMVEGSEQQDMVIFDWLGEQRRIDLPVEIDTTDLLSIQRVDEAVGPGTFQEVPGAVLLREFPSSTSSPRVIGFT